MIALEKTEFQKLFREYMKKLGFRSKGNICYRYLEHDYLIIVDLEHSSYNKAYGVDYGVVYEADTVEKSISPKTDWRGSFLFTADPEEDIARYPLEDMRIRYGRELTRWFIYSERTEEDFLCSMDENVQKRLVKVYDKGFVLDQYRKNWVSFRRIPYETVRKICRLAGLDAEQVIRFRDGSRI